MDSDDYDWEWQRLRLENLLQSVDGDAFEALFQKIAKLAWKTNFTPTIPMGPRGDLKCDGFRSDTREVFQCYGPRYGKTDVDFALNKIDEDFRGALAHWQDEMRKWVFVVNLYRDKVPSELVRLVAQLSAKLSLLAELWTRIELCEIVKKLNARDREEVCGRAPSRGDMVRAVTYANIGRALAFIRSGAVQETGGPIKLPASVEEKIEFNVLPVSARHFLGIGQLGSDRVRQYLHDYIDPNESQSMADAFRDRFYDLRARGTEPKEMFQELLAFAGGATGDTDRDSAALAIVTHFFALCEIFETPPTAPAL